MVPQIVLILLISMAFGVTSVPNASSEIAKSRKHNVNMTHVAESIEEFFPTGRKLGSLKGSRKLESFNKSRVVLSGNITILSENNTFELGFFKTNDENRWYLGIWFASVPSPTYVWVANRERPIKNPSLATLEITKDGKLVLKQDSRTIIWETSNLDKASDIKLLDQGNLVLVSTEGNLIWQSFDFPTDTWLPGMNLTATKWLTSWKSSTDPSQGRYSLRLQPSSYGEIVLVYNGTYPYWSTGNWTENAFVGVPEMTVPYIYKFNFVAPFTPMASFGYSEVPIENGVPPPLTRFIVDFTGQIKQFTWFQQAQSWNMFWSQPENLCKTYGLCGNLGFCNSKTLNPCKCLPGFNPLDSDSWIAGDFSGGCRRESNEMCSKKDGFEEVGIVSYDGARVVSITETRSECEKECLGSCSCIGLYHNERTKLCKNLYGSLLNLRNLTSDGTIEDKLYVRVQGGGNTQKKQIQGRLLLIEMICGFVVILSVGIGTFLVLKRRRIRKKNKEEEDVFPIMNLKVFSYKELNAATKGFSEKLGHGGFGTVFLGELSDSSLVAVKRLERPGGGEKEFRAEVCTIGNIQHVNLVRLRGFCSENSHRLLVYEYMPKGSLSAYLRRDGQNLSWDVRFRVAVGTAKGIAYLHEECRSCIIHCDIKPENILLDEDFSAKVSDFGLAKLLGRDFSRVLATMRGTWGYVAPEWISGLAITTKADVYSYGMTLLELIGGRRNVEAPPSAKGEEGGTEEKWFFPPWAARQIVEGNTAAVIDERLCGMYDVTEAERVGLVAVWCIQDDESMRPSMGMVVKMLEGVVEVAMPSPPKLLQALVSGESFHGVGVDSDNGTSRGTSRGGGFSSGYNPQPSIVSGESQASV
ncbi:G-type lectin S-receptor-like serine/threonine-protein kinase SD2-2 [Nicotiana tomentosiformis]|uniref:G-type lectin S-receptor-like serine/threonine-protein kinase SD2-2 n=1 Tax=Nicotiana tomentosiformis TaxID=4098 RepID=UPI00051C14E8|nr:G-type lectin S-receptor-like serine/threonine-protein kinase SD2-2 [Nicotiana tomentosiformis]